MTDLRTRLTAALRAAGFYTRQADTAADVLLSELGLTRETAPSMPHWSRYATEWVQE